MSVVSNRVSIQEMPVAMDIGATTREEDEWYGYGEEQETYGVDAVGRAVQCFKCNGMGHMARDCWTKGKGKGDFGWKGGGKGDGGKNGSKGNYYDYGKGGGKGKGKFSGKCFKCGKEGHRAVDCRSVNGVDGHEEVRSEAAEGEYPMVKKSCDTVWMLTANVSKTVATREEQWPGLETLQVKRPKLKIQPVRNWIKVKNRYEILEAINEENEIEELWDPPGLEKIKKKFIGTVTKRVKGKVERNVPGVAGKEDCDRCQPCGGDCGDSKNNLVKEIMTVNKGTHLGSGKQGLCAIMFHLTNVKKMLISVDRLGAAGNHVNFGPEKCDNYIINKKTGRKIEMRKKGGVYEIDVVFRCGETWEQGVMTVDSGAEDCVMPWNWYKKVEASEKAHGVQFMGADGTDLGNYGKKLMEFIPKADFKVFTGQA